MKKAVRVGARYVAVIGIMEARTGVCQLKDMEAGSQEEVKLASLLDRVVEKVGEDSLDFYSPTKDFMINAPISL